MTRQMAAVVALYAFLLAGGLWQILGVFQSGMRLPAAPIIIALALWLCGAHFFHLQKAGVAAGGAARASAQKFLAWCLLIFAGGFLIELAGVHTGLLFGQYQYGDALQPLLLDVPVAIGSAWLIMLISSAAVAQKIFPASWRARPIAYSCLVAGLMAVFDFFMEPAAIKLNYWHWESGGVPAQNYAAWFVFGLMLAYSGAAMNFFEKKFPPVAAHSYFAQMGYFILVRLS